MRNHLVHTVNEKPTSRWVFHFLDQVYKPNSVVRPFEGNAGRPSIWDVTYATPQAALPVPLLQNGSYCCRHRVVKVVRDTALHEGKDFAVSISKFP